LSLQYSHFSKFAEARVGFGGKFTLISILPMVPCSIQNGRPYLTKRSGRRARFSKTTVFLARVRLIYNFFIWRNCEMGFGGFLTAKYLIDVLGVKTF
jgi:hypothetical protein